MKHQSKEKNIFWLITPEDSSSWEDEGVGCCSNDQGKMERILSTSKLFLWYIMAIACTIFLSRLH